METDQLPPPPLPPREISLQRRTHYAYMHGWLQLCHLDEPGNSHVYIAYSLFDTTLPLPIPIREVLKVFGAQCGSSLVPCCLYRRSMLQWQWHSVSVKSFNQ